MYCNFQYTSSYSLVKLTPLSSVEALSVIGREVISEFVMLIGRELSCECVTPIDRELSSECVMLIGREVIVSGLDVLGFLAVAASTFRIIGRIFIFDISSKFPNQVYYVGV